MIRGLTRLKGVEGEGGRGNAIVADEHCLGRVGMGKEERGGDQESKIKVLAVHEYFMYPF